MGWTRTPMILGMLFWGVVGWAADRAQAPNPQITVFVMDPAARSEKLVASAEQDAARILRGAGLDVKWVNCPSKLGASNDGCGQKLEAEAFVIRIVAQGRSVTNETFGISFLTEDRGAYADVFFNPIRRVREVNREVSSATVLGNVIAHELGHLLLPPPGHSLDGIMRAELETRSWAFRTFTPPQAREVLSRLRRLPSVALTSVPVQ